MDIRPTTKHTTPSGKEYEVKTYLTARERNELRGVFLNSTIVTPGAEKPAVPELTGSFLEKAEYKVIELAITTYDGSAEKILDRLLDGSPEDYDAVVGEAHKVGNFTQAK